MKNREWNVEVYRVMPMFGICLLHSITQCGHPNGRMAALLLPCVNGFVFISGWFGIRFGFVKFAKLFFNSLYACAIAVGFAAIFAPDFLSVSKECFHLIRSIALGQWFFVSYLLLMLVAPALNFVIDRMDSATARQLAVPAALLMLWNWTSELPLFCLIPRPPGFGSYTFTSLALTYVTSRVIRKYDLLSRLGTRAAVSVLCGLAVIFVYLPSWHLSSYASPLAIVFAGLLFFLVRRKRNHLMVSLGRICARIAPSMFTVYLFHSHVIGFTIMTRVESHFLHLGLGIGCAYLLTAVVVFLVGIVVDVPRRMAGWAICSRRKLFG